MSKKPDRALGFMDKVGLLSSALGIQESSTWTPESVAPSQEYWLITGTAGEYDDRQEWVVSVHATKDEAEQVLAEFEAQRLEPEMHTNAFTKNVERPYMWAEYWVSGPFTNVGTFFQKNFEY
jgi:hypothetical protein